MGRAYRSSVSRAGGLREVAQRAMPVLRHGCTTRSWRQARADSRSRSTSLQAVAVLDHRRNNCGRSRASRSLRRGLIGTAASGAHQQASARSPAIEREAHARASSRHTAQQARA